MNKETIKEIRDLRKSGMKLREIAGKLKISVTSVVYYTDEESRKKRITQSVEYFRRLPKERKQEIYKKRNDTVRLWLNNKYKTDPEFREKKREYARNFYKNNMKEELDEA